MIKRIKNKGFTLIELLAVIVILAVIALIAVPQILNILNRARKSAAEDTTNGIIKSAENYVTSFMLQNNGSFPEKTLNFECTTDGCILQTELNDYNKENLTTLDFKGTKPTSGTITISNSGKNIIANNLKINGFTCIYDGEKSTCGDYKDRVVLKEIFNEKGIVGSYEKVLAIVYLDPTDLSKECNADNLETITDEGPNTGCMKWYAYKDENNQYTMIADHNITGTVTWNNTDGSSSTNYNGPKEVLDELSTATTNWSEKLVAPTPYTASWTYGEQSHTYTIDYSKYGNRARLISAEEIAEITKNDRSNGADYTKADPNWGLASNWFLLDRATGECYNQEKLCVVSQSKYAWLFDNTSSCINNGCNVAQSGIFGYWTSSPYVNSSNKSWYVHATDQLDYFYEVLTKNLYGVRPVITVKKSDLLY